MPKVVVLLQARMKSNQLPGKTLHLIQGKPMLEHVIDRLKAAETPDSILVCTSTHEDDRLLLELAESKGVKWFAGSEEDVLDRFIQAAHREKAKIVVRASGKDPLVDPIYLDKLVEYHRKSMVDYTSVKQLPVGVAVETISTKALEKAYQLADNPEMSKYMTLYFKEDFFHIQMLEAEESLRRPNYWLRVDTPEDLKLMEEIYQRLYRPGSIIALKDVVRLLDENPQLAEINIHRVPKKVERMVMLKWGSPKISLVPGE